LGAPFYLRYFPDICAEPSNRLSPIKPSISSHLGDVPSKSSPFILPKQESLYCPPPLPRFQSETIRFWASDHPILLSLFRGPPLRFFSSALCHRSFKLAPPSPPSFGVNLLGFPSYLRFLGRFWVMFVAEDKFPSCLSSLVQFCFPPLPFANPPGCFALVPTFFTVFSSRSVGLRHQCDSPLFLSAMQSLVLAGSHARRCDASSSFTLEGAGTTP